MLKRITCDKCGSVLDLDISSIWEGNREMEDYTCPICYNLVWQEFTDRIPHVTLGSKGNVN